MKLKVNQLPKNVHTEAVTACCWSPGNELFTCSDDKTVQRWGMEGESLGKVCSLDSFVTDMDWLPATGRHASQSFAVSCSDGTFRLMNQSGRQEKRVEASTAAVISLRWNYEGSALVTAGEDGAVKVWSRSGMLRSVIATSAKPVYSVCWGADNEMILYATGRDLIIQSVQADRRQLKWKAHDGVVMKAAWNPVNGLIVSGGEDCMYKVWDSFGRQLFQSAPFDTVVTSVAWSPNGEVFSVGSYNTLRLCDKTGWSYSRAKPTSGSLYNIAWTSDGTQLAGAGANGAVVFGELVGRQLEWNNVEVTLTDSKHIRVQDVFDETVEELDFRDRVVDMALGYGYLIVAKATQCFIYTLPNWNTPHMFDLRAPVNLIIQAEKHFVMVDNLNGVQVFSYDGRVMCNPRFPGMRVDFLNRRTLSLSSDTVAVVGKSEAAAASGGDSKVVRIFDAHTGRAVSTITHNLDIVDIALSQHSTDMNERKLVFIDQNRDLYITPVVKEHPIKLQTMVDCAIWNDSSDMLAALADGKLVTWMYPAAVFVDKDLVDGIRESKDGGDFGKMPQFSTFFGSRVTVRRADGALVTSSVNIYPPVLYEFVGGRRWEEAVRLCRFVKSKGLWTCLAAMSLFYQHLDTAEVALAAIDEVDKLHYVLHIKDIPSAEGRSAELALYRRSTEEAEAILLQASPPLVYRAIQMNIRLFRWDRALDLAIQHKTHVDTVLAYRQRSLRATKRAETSERFLQFAAEVTIDWDAINNKIAREEERERERGGYK